MAWQDQAFEVLLARPLLPSSAWNVRPILLEEFMRTSTRRYCGALAACTKLSMYTEKEVLSSPLPIALYRSLTSA